MYSEEDVYFPEDIISLNDNEIFIDCGAYTGDTISQFMRQANNSYDRIVAFEPSAETFEILKKNLKSYANIQFCNYATWNEKTELLIETNSLNSAGNKVLTKNADVQEVERIQAITIDEICINIPVTMIKMDVEGAELNSLKGAIKTIEKTHCKLAICIYHSNEDMVAIAEWIHENFSFYKLYIRYHTANLGDTVLYAIE